ETQVIIKEIVEPTLKGCIDEGFPFRGILFLGLMLTGETVSPIIRADEEQDVYIVALPKLLEYNVRFGDPETQAILVRLESDLIEICEAMLDGKLAETQIKWSQGNSACVVLAAEGYPQKPRTGDQISGLEEAGKIENVTIFHAGTKNSEGETSPPTFLTSGGRVLGVTATGDSLNEALATAYDAARLISWPGMQYRRDIGK
ncbi:MAG TPA: phosphoribosylglycinamide synthetase C domain-containing protein, partial [Pyrinomonadaceae bacterium]|nr:phosphoribosylglycinamide synthetase C domain-containing protein [Pyrinomonadaceae bacterium]